MLGVDRPAHPGRGHDPAAGGARREGHLDRHVRRRTTSRSSGAGRCCTARCSSSSPTSTGATSTSCCWTCRPAPATSRSRWPSCVPPAELLVVTTPQQAAARGRRARRHRSPLQTHQQIAGVIENMSWLPCPHCDERVDVFGTGGGQAVADGAHPHARRAGAAARPGPDRPAAARGRRRGPAARARRPGLARRRRARAVAAQLGDRARGLAGRSPGPDPRRSLTLRRRRGQVRRRGRTGGVAATGPSVPGCSRSVGGGVGGRRGRRSCVGPGRRRRVERVQQVLAHERPRVEVAQVEVAAARARARVVDLGARLVGHRAQLAEEPAASAAYCGQLSGPSTSSATTARTSISPVPMSNTRLSPSSPPKRDA